MIIQDKRGMIDYALEKGYDEWVVKWLKDWIEKWIEKGIKKMINNLMDSMWISENEAKKILNI
jgi:hypothetical protein